eukprot:15466157-Alexandrium_andersonii.AAC.1
MPACGAACRPPPAAIRRAERRAARRRRGLGGAGVLLRGARRPVADAARIISVGREPRPAT